MTMLQAQKDEEDENSMYMCSCCRSVLGKKDSPPIGGMCPECHKSRSDHLTVLYYNVERVLSHALQPGIGYRELLEHVANARDGLRRVMRSMSWRDPF